MNHEACVDYDYYEVERKRMKYQMRFIELAIAFLAVYCMVLS